MMGLSQNFTAVFLIVPAFGSVFVNFMRENEWIWSNKKAAVKFYDSLNYYKKDY